MVRLTDCPGMTIVVDWEVKHQTKPKPWEQSDLGPYCLQYRLQYIRTKFELRHEISNNVVCATSKASDQTAQTRSVIRAFASRLNML